MTGISKSQVSRFCEEIDVQVKAFLERPIEGHWLYLWLDATYIKTRKAGRIVPVAAIVAVGSDTEGRREVPGLISRRRSVGGCCSCTTLGDMTLMNREDIVRLPVLLYCFP